ncbi:MAG: DUF2294 domain-containing protein [Elusimicrobiota bacterium]
MNSKYKTVGFMKDNKTKGQVESLISEALIKFEKEYMGRGPIETKTYLIKDMIFVRLKGVLTPAEEQLTKTVEGADLIKKIRVQLLENGRPLLQKIVLDVTGCQVKSLHTDISTKTGERVIIFILEEDLENKFSVDKE